MAARRPHSTSPSSSAPATSPAADPGATFADLGVADALSRVLAAGGITQPFPIQAATLPDAIAGRDVLGRGRTGSGKTYAFLLPLLTRLAGGSRPRPGRPRALILAPTRELATQIHEAMSPLADALSLRTLTVFGGVGPGRQIAGLRAGVDVVVACPGRLADHIDAGHADLRDVAITVLDEADHMADLGFLPVVRRLLEQTPRGGQRMLFSATLDAGVDVLVKRFMSDPVVHSVDSAKSPVPVMTHHVLHVSADDRFAVLADLAAAPGRAVVFTRTKRGAKTLTRRLVAAGVPAVELHGNLAQNARTRNLQQFVDGRARTLVATDIAARGIHVDDVELVIHADPPVEHKAYLHRSGRTARAGATGTVITLMADAQRAEVRELTRKAGIVATTTRLRPGDALLRQLAPGERTFVTPAPAEPVAATADRQAAGHGGRRRRGGSSTDRSMPAPTGGSGSRRATTSSRTSSNAPSRSNGNAPSRSNGAAPRKSAAAPVRQGGAAGFSSRFRGR